MNISHNFLNKVVKGFVIGVANFSRTANNNYCFDIFNILPGQSGEISLEVYHSYGLKHVDVQIRILPLTCLKWIEVNWHIFLKTFPDI